VFVATGKADPLGETEESQQLAVAEARLAARVMLKQDKAVPKTDDGRLRGVREVGVCLDRGSVFVTLRVSEIDMRRASALDAALRQSLQHSPMQH
jgi:hypothetical protein